MQWAGSADRFSPRLPAFVRAFLVAAILAISSLAVADSARASTDNYCLSCFIPSNTYVVNPRYHYNYGSYVNYLGLGDRWMGAGAWDYAGFIWGWNNVYHGYGGTAYARAAAGFSGSQSGATAAARATY